MHPPQRSMASVKKHPLTRACRQHRPGCLLCPTLVICSVYSGMACLTLAPATRTAMPGCLTCSRDAPRLTQHSMYRLAERARVSLASLNPSSQPSNIHATPIAQSRGSGAPKNWRLPSGNLGQPSSLLAVLNLRRDCIKPFREPRQRQERPGWPHFLKRVFPGWECSGELITTSTAQHNIS